MPYYTATRRAGGSSAPATDGSRTIVLHDAQPREEGGGESDAGRGETSDAAGSIGSGADRERDVVGVLRLRGARRRGPRVAWTEDVVDNEGLGRKKSKSTF